MGRPLNKKFFGNRNAGSASTTADDGLGGSGVLSVTLGGTNNSSGYTNNAAVTFSAPELSGDGAVTATGRVKVTSGGITSIEILEAGSGYLTAPTITLPTGTQGTLTLTVNLQPRTGQQSNALLLTARINSTARAYSDIIKQVGSRRYKVENQDGVGIVKLIAGNITAAGQATLTATDSAGKTYYVTKITAHKALLTQYGTIGWQFATGTMAPWTFGSAVANYSVKVNNG